MLAVGVGAAGIAAHLGASTTAQILTAAWSAVARWWAGIPAAQAPGDPSARADRSVNLDVGETVMIEAGMRTEPARSNTGAPTGWPSTGKACSLRPAHTALPSWWATVCWSIRSSHPSVFTSQPKGASMEIAIVILIIAVIFIARSVKVVPQQNAWVKERLGKYAGTLTLASTFWCRLWTAWPIGTASGNSLDVPSQICITKDNTQLQVDGILYFQVTDPMRASYGSSNYIMAVTQLAQTSLRSVIGKLELDKTFEERDIINAQVVQAIDEAALNWGVKVLRYEIKDLTPPKEILHAMQQQITAEREKRALIAASEAAARNKSTSPPASARPSSPALKVKSRPSSTRPRAKPNPSRPWPRPPHRPLNAWLPPSASQGRASRTAQGC